jgi:spore coat protein U-like protein
MRDMWWTNRKAQYGKYYEAFKSYPWYAGGGIPPLTYGNNANGTQRYLANTFNGDKILYNIKTPNGADWGDVAHNSALTVVSNGTNQANNITIVIPKGQNPSFANGSAYSDTISASMSY